MITPWFGERLRAFDRFDALMDKMLTDMPSNGFAWSPSVDVKESHEAYTLHVELPGMKLEDVHVDLSGNILTISGAREVKKEEKDENVVCRERRYGKFLRSFHLDGSVKGDAIQAHFKDGVLTVVVPRTELPNTRHIPVKLG